MNAELLLAHFNRISDAPDAIARLRLLILDLAVRGKLVEQDPNDEPASRLLKRIHTEKARLAKAGIIRSQKVFESIPGDEYFGLPRGWVWARWESIALKIGDIDHKMPDSVSDGIPFISPRDFLPGNRIDFDRAKRVSIEDFLRLSAKIKAGPGDLIYPRYGTIGENRMITEERDFLVSYSCAVVKVMHGLIDPRFQFVFSISSLCKEQAKAAENKTTQANVGIKSIQEFAVALPPAEEQRRIVAKVDELMALCDGLDAAQREQETRQDQLTASTHHHLNNGGDADELRNHARFFIGHLPRLTSRPDQINQLRQTILNLAVRGKIVPQDSKEESAAQLRKRIQTEKQRLLKKGSIRSILPERPIESTETLLAIPSSWTWVRLADLLFGDSQNGHSKKPDDAPDGTPILRISAGTVRPDGIVAEEEHKLLGGVSSADQKRYELQAGDLLACRFNGNTRFVGRITLYEGYLGLKLIYPDKLIRMRVLPGFVVPKLVRYFAESSIVRKDIEGYCATTVGNWGISASNLKEVKLPLPPFAEQQRIVAKVDELMTLCEQLESSITTAQTETSRLLESVLHRALQDATLA